MSEKSAISNISAESAAQGGVLLKLIIFSLSLGILPLSSYYGSLQYLWDGNTTFAAITAVVAANIVLVAYIITSLAEERKGTISEAKPRAETRKER